MMEKPIIIMLFMWCVSFSVLGGQYTLAHDFNIELVNTWTDFDGDGFPDNLPIQSEILKVVNADELNQISTNVVSGNFTTNSTFYDKIETSTTAAAFVGWELITLLTGTYIFYFLYIMGVPSHFILIIVVVYSALLARAVVGYIRGE